VPGCTEYAGTDTGDAALPEDKAELWAGWSLGDWEANWRMRYIGATTEHCSAPTLTSMAVANGWNIARYCSNPANGTNTLGATTYHSVQVSYHIAEWDTRLTFGVENLFDKKPPISTQAFANSYDRTAYEVPGMFPYLRIEKSF
jgi:iron complex outermembrane receptor protein